MAKYDRRRTRSSTFAGMKYAKCSKRSWNFEFLQKRNNNLILTRTLSIVQTPFEK